MAFQSYGSHRHLAPLDGTFDHRRARAKLAKKPNVEELLGYLEGKGAMDEVYKSIMLDILTVDERPCVKIDADGFAEPRKKPVAPENRKRKSSFTDQRGDRGKARISEDRKPRIPLSNDRLHQKRVKQNNRQMQSQSARAARARPVKMSKVKEEVDEADKNVEVKKENKKTTIKGRGRGLLRRWSRSDHQDVGRVPLREKHVARVKTESMEAARGVNACSSKKAAFANSAVKEEPAFANSAVKEEPEHYEGTRLPMKGVDSQMKNVKRAKCSFADNSGEKYVEGEGSSKSCPELIILDGDKVAKRAIASGFVCSKKYHSSMAGEGCSSAVDSEFRRELFEVLKKPYNKEEYKRSREAIRAGSYLDYHPGVQRKLTRYRYKRDKLLIIVRGFLFWLQNLTREGSFEPWKDKQCLELELPSR